VTELTLQEAVAVLSQKFIVEEGVVGVGYRLSEPRIVVYVEDEYTARRVPGTLLGYRVEVVITGRLYALSTTPLVSGATGRLLSGAEVSKTSRVRPVPGGVSVGSVLVTAGTLACVVYDAETGKPLILSNRHVFWGPKGTAILQPGSYDGGRDPDDVIGRVLRFTEIREYPDTNIVDAALGEPVSPGTVSSEVLDIGVIAGVEEAREGAVVCKSGRSTCYTCGRIVDTGATVKVYGYKTPSGYAVFEDQVIVEPAISSPGDSGSIAVNPETKRAIGLVFAGSDKVTVMNKASNVSRLLRVSFTPITPRPARPAEAALSLLASTAPLAVVGAVVIAAASRAGKSY
jgi:hypothetical protein